MAEKKEPKFKKGGLVSETKYKKAWVSFTLEELTSMKFDLKKTTIKEVIAHVRKKCGLSEKRERKSTAK